MFVLKWGQKVVYKPLRGKPCLRLVSWDGRVSEITAKHAEILYGLICNEKFNTDSVMSSHYKVFYLVTFLSQSEYERVTKNSPTLTWRIT